MPVVVKKYHRRKSQSISFYEYGKITSLKSLSSHIDIFKPVISYRRS